MILILNFNIESPWDEQMPFQKKIKRIQFFTNKNQQTRRMSIFIPHMQSMKIKANENIKASIQMGHYIKFSLLDKAFAV